VEAAAEVRNQLRRFPGDFQGTLLLAEIEAEDLKNLAAAETILTQWLSNHARDSGQEAIGLTRLADWHLHLAHDVQGARGFLEQIVSRFPDSRAALLAEQRLAHLDYETQPKVTSLRLREGLGPPVDTEAPPPPLSEHSPSLEVAELVQHLASYPHDLAAYQATQDARYLKLAAERHPHEPLVAFQVAGHNLFPEQQREWLYRLKALDPNNPPANSLSARHYFQTAQPEQAIHALQVAATKPGIHDYLTERMQGLEELYLRSGRSPAEAKALGMTGLALPLLPQLNELAQETLALQRQYAAAGETASAEALARYQVFLARQLSQGQGATCLINQRVGMAMEREAVALLDPAQACDFLGQSPAERLEALQNQTTRMEGTIRWFGQRLPQASDTELIAYIDRVKLYGEPAAIQWLRGQQP
jgi:hypothetical protein